MRSGIAVACALLSLGATASSARSPDAAGATNRPMPSVAQSGMHAERVTLDGHTYDVFTVDPREVRIDLHGRDADGRRYADFARVQRRLATNGGMFSRDFSPVGLYVEDGVSRAALNARDSAGGNFYMKPNGVFFLTRGDTARILETGAFAAARRRNVWIATQSGPLLVRRGTIHPSLRPTTRRGFIRSGVGVRGDGTVVFAISNQAVGLHEFARLFRHVLRCDDALYLDGAISRTYLPALRRTRLEGDFGPIITVSFPAGG